MMRKNFGASCALCIDPPLHSQSRTSLHAFSPRGTRYLLGKLDLANATRLVMAKPLQGPAVKTEVILLFVVNCDGIRFLAFLQQHTEDCIWRLECCTFPVLAG